MTFLPIVERELRIKARRSRTYYARCAMVLTFAVMSFGIMALDWNLGKNPTLIGRDLFWALSGLGFAWALIAGPVITADCLSEEKREGTLGLLFLTNLKGHDVVLGKLTATSLPIFYSLVAGLPVLSVAFFFGGVMAGEFWRMILTLLATLLFSLTTGVFVSSISRDGRRAFLTTAFIILLCAASPWIRGYLATRAPAMFPPPMPSPAYNFGLVADSQYSSMRGSFWWSLAGLVFSAAISLGLASLILPRAWQEKVVESNPRSPQSNDAQVASAISRHLHSKRTRLLAKNPVLWLAERTALNRYAVAVCWTLGLGLWVLGLVTMQRRSVAPEFAFLAVYALHAAMKGWVAWEASRQFAEDRRNGSLELLLVTPLAERTIFAGWLTGLIRRFAGPVALLLSVDVLLWRNGADGVWLLAVLGATAIFLADGYTLCWVGLWMGVTAKNSTQAFSRTVSYVLLYPWMAFLLLQGIFGVLAQGSVLPREPVWLVAAWFACGYLLDLGLCVWSIGKLGGGFRASVSGGIEPVGMCPRRR